MTASTASRARTLSLRELNRATSARQMLLNRVSVPAVDAVEHLVGMQAQEPMDPYLGLWSRLEGFSPSELAGLLLEHRAVRCTLMRGTIHLVNAGDYLVLRPFVQPMLDRIFRNGRAFGARVNVDLDRIRDACVELVRQEPRTRGELRRLLAERWPEEDAEAMSFILLTVPLVQATPRGVWGSAGAARWALAEEWISRPIPEVAPVEEVVLRYLGAFGPASVADARQWCGVGGLREVFERLRPRLVTFRDPSGRELFDLPDAPRPDAGTPAPPRFLPQFDNVFLSHADRSRMSPEQFGGEMKNIWNAIGTGRLAGRGQKVISWSMFTVDGYLAGTWKAQKDGPRAVLQVQPMVKLSAADGEQLAAEGRALLSLLAPDSDPSVSEVRFTS